MSETIYRIFASVNEDGLPSQLLAGTNSWMIAQEWLDRAHRDGWATAWVEALAAIGHDTERRAA